MPFDDELGARLREERDQLPATADPAAVLETLKPDMRRARRVRRLTHAGVAALLLVGGVALARVGADGGDGALEIVPAVGEDEPSELPRPETEVATTVPGRALTTTTSVDDDVATDDLLTDDARTDERPPAPAPDSVPRSTPADDDPPHSSAGVNHHPSTSEPARSLTDAPPQPGTDDDPADDPPSTTAPETVTPTTVDDDEHGVDDEHHDDATTTTSPSTTAPAAPARFDSACGYVLADTSGAQVEIVQIVPAAGYQAKVEPGDGGSLKVHFEGGGEDCEFSVS